jgi:hypothetical protein
MGGFNGLGDLAAADEQVVEQQILAPDHDVDPAGAGYGQGE